MTLRPVLCSLVFFLLLGTNTIGSAEGLSGNRTLRVKTIYLDPWYGGRQAGPRFAKNINGKEFTLIIAQRLQGMLEAEGFKVMLSRTDDRFVHARNRIIQSREQGAQVHVAIKVSRADKNCARIFSAAPERRKTRAGAKKQKPGEHLEQLDNVFTDLKVKAIREESLLLANSVATRLKSGPTADCIEMARGKGYLLRHTQLPAVVVDFRVSPKSRPRPFVFDEASLDKTIRLLADAITLYSTEQASKTNIAMFAPSQGGGRSAEK